MDHFARYIVGREDLRFIVAGALNTIVGWLIFFGIYETFGQTLHYLGTLVCTYIVSIFHSFLWLRYFVFRSRGNFVRQLIGSYLSYGALFVLNGVLLAMAVEVMNLDVYVSQIAITVIVVILSFIVHRGLVFRHR